MRSLTFDELIVATGGTPVGIADEVAMVNRIEIDSRKVQPGDVFWALEGASLNGHDYVQQAFDNGAIAAVVEEEQCQLDRTIQVQDSLMALWDFADWYRKQFDALVIGVTGSVGKTTTRRMIATVLSARFKGVESPKNYNNQFGVPLSLLQLEDHHDFGVFELGASQPGEIGELAEVIHPEVGVITAIGPSHLDEFGSYENIVATKGQLLDHLPEEGFAVLNGDDRNVRQLAEKAKCEVILVGERKHNDLIATNVVVENHEMKFTVETSVFVLPVSGRHHLIAALSAIAIGRRIDMTDEEIQTGLSSFTATEGRTRTLSIGPWTVIDDTYNANPLSMSAACRTLKDWKTPGKKILFAGDMLSLGEWSENFHHLLGEEVTRSKIDCLITFGSQAALVAGSARKNGMDAGCLGTCRDQETAMLLLDLWLEPGDVLLIKGSRGMKMESFLPLLHQLAKSKSETLPLQDSIQRKVA
ncbi:UDP-N-acetylmuramoyl-tripeptide--D-alanyl-D-alanine ligase [Planctomicrobium sp.]|jgi:UDP-N-acetylmuramoyl-tripeptide--D-alanyl-D-alanine ligase|nr:UDP-N-acetylmuramoyl-tripeptide--D-alanyl-D-alanine ligase [Planctomicrobium sp.]MDA7527549.1 UDP-N-acetylmuramoyl-tripeptide--D-alanyl-D-alanine ligase [bacterium]MDB4731849.1 UDP-N-acetylmuramoyl-tripeptide--D-alanyl-D-alanine ligase [bacterium]MDB4732810.1 UDP-N-acetylmuramoyl-tripeptide--D-alanyl-D-alanine ligase [Planctomicrobium sp.]